LEVTFHYQEYGEFIGMDEAAKIMGQMLAL
jgi:hypothetical protein